MHAGNKDVSYSDLFKKVEDGSIKSITYSGTTGGTSIIAKDAGGTVFETFGVITDGDLASLRSKGVEISF